MSIVYENAIVRIAMADFAAAETSGGGKLNMIGGNITDFGVGSERTGRFTLIVNVIVPPSAHGMTARVKLTLESEHGDPVKPREFADDFENVMSFTDPADSDSTTRRGVRRDRHQWLWQFNDGLRLETGKLYRWRLFIDDKTRDHWTEEFSVYDMRSDNS